MGGIISPPFGGYIGSSNLVLLTLVLLSPPGYARPGERHAYASTNTATYSTSRIMLSVLPRLGDSPRAFPLIGMGCIQPSAHTVPLSISARTRECTTICFHPSLPWL